MFLIGLAHGQRPYLNESLSNRTHNALIACNLITQNVFMRISFYLEHYIIPIVGPENLCLNNLNNDDQCKMNIEKDKKLINSNDLLFYKIFSVGCFFLTLSLFIILILRMTNNSKTKTTQQESVSSFKNLKSKCAIAKSSTVLSKDLKKSSLKV